MSVKIEGLHKSFGDKIILSDFSFSFSDTGLYVIRGESGTGKTTLLRMIAGIDNDYVGTISRDERGVSMCFQEYRLFDTATALENVTRVSFKNATDNDVLYAKSLFRRLNLTDDDMKLYPRELSGGMKQRIAFIRAVAKKAAVLILDEPTKEVDPENAKIMREIIKEEACTRLVIMVTHKTEDVSDINAVTVDIGAR